MCARMKIIDIAYSRILGNQYILKIYVERPSSINKVFSCDNGKW